MRFRHQGAVTEEQLECAFILAESKRAHRTRSTLAYKPTAEASHPDPIYSHCNLFFKYVCIYYVCMCACYQGKMLFHSVETKEQEELFMTKELAYTKPLVSSHAYIRKYKPIYLKK